MHPLNIKPHASSFDRGVCRGALLFLALALALVGSGCANAGGRIDILGIPRKDDAKNVTNRHTIHQQTPTAPPAPAANTPATTESEEAGP